LTDFIQAQRGGFFSPRQSLNSSIFEVTLEPGLTPKSWPG
jgi:hypothetical protein